MRFEYNNKNLLCYCWCYFITGSIDAKELKVAMRALGFEPKKEEIRKVNISFYFFFFFEIFILRVMYSAGHSFY